MSTILKFILKILALPFRLIWWATSQKIYPAGQPFNMRKPLVIDGDTVFHDGKKIRIWGIDAPEMSETSGAAAKAHLQHLVELRNIHVVPREIDKYDRVVAQLFCGRGDIGQTMVEDGYALSWGNRYNGAERRARRKKNGLWKKGQIANPALARAAAAR